MKLQKWIETNVWEKAYFVPEKLGEKRSIYTTPYSLPIIASLIDGKCSKANWKLSNPRGLTLSLFDNIKPLLSRYGASWFYITDPDNVLSEFQWEKVIDPKYAQIYELHELVVNPAKEGGISRLGIMLHTLDCLVLFEMLEHFEINFYGSAERWEEIKKLLEL